MKQPMTAAAVHKQYEETVIAFRRQMAEPALRAVFTGQIDGFVRRCAAGLWQKDGGLTPLHVELLYSISVDFARGFCGEIKDFPAF